MSIATEIQRLQTAKADIKTAIENKGVTVGDGTIDTYAEKISEISGGGSGDYDQGYEDGKNSVVDNAKLCKRIQFKSLNVFGKSEVVLDLDNVTTLESLCDVSSAEEANTTVEHLTINCLNEISKMTYMLRAVSGADTKLKRVTFNANTENTTHFAYAFSNCRALETIDGLPLDFSSCTSIVHIFQSCTALIDVRVVKETIKIGFNVSYSPNLSAETIQSIIDGLADLTGGTAQTLTLHATVGGKLTDEQKATITAKNWELVY